MGENSLTIGPCREEELPSLFAIASESFATSWSEEQFRREWSLPLSTILVARRGSPSTPVIGYIVYWLIVDELHIHDIAVHPDKRRQGVASRLLTAATRQALSRAARRATLEVRSTNRPARQLYEKHGFDVRGIRKGYYSDTGDDALILWAELGKTNDDLCGCP